MTWTLSYSLTGEENSWVDTPFAFTDVTETPTSFWYRVAVPNYTNYIHAAGVVITQRVVHIEFPEVKKVFDGTDDCPPPGYISTNLTTEAENMVAGEEIDAEARGHFDSPALTRLRSS